MKEAKVSNATRRYERYLRDAQKETFILRLYVTGASPASTHAIANLKALCDEHLKGRFQLEVIDVFQRTALARGEQIIATPTLVKLLPAPIQRFIGDMSGVGGKLFGLDLQPAAERQQK
jgi:circadian clock protein KaiB